MESPRREIKLKICVVGQSRVGKTSLIRRFVHDQFDEKYLYTIGANVSKRTFDLVLPGSDDRWSLVLTLWDIMGEKGFLDLLREAYFQGTSGVVAVADLSRPETFEEVDMWIGAIKEVAGTDTPVILVANKLDLVDPRKVDCSPLTATAARHCAPLLPTSAKIGENVESAFTLVARLAMGTLFHQREPPLAAAKQ
ncbi:MAG: GTP-binding protein [Euryarchaeota archaeon]|nr:GTP-binding protein [Euryarchaeota archaeon]